MRIRFKLIALLLVFLIAVTSVGVQATWLYADGSPDSIMYNLVMSLFAWTELDQEEMMSVAEKFDAMQMPRCADTMRKRANESDKLVIEPEPEEQPEEQPQEQEDVEQKNTPKTDNPKTESSFNFLNLL